MEIEIESDIPLLATESEGLKTASANPDENTRGRSFAFSYLLLVGVEQRTCIEILDSLKNPLCGIY